MTSPWHILDEYDPELHGKPEEKAPPANRALALAVTLALVGLPFVVWFVARFI